MLLSDCPLRWAQYFTYASVSPSRKSGCLLLFLVNVDLKFPQSPSAQSNQLVSCLLTGYVLIIAGLNGSGSTPQYISCICFGAARVAWWAASV